MSFAELITNALVSGIVSFASIFNPLIAETIANKQPAQPSSIVEIAEIEPIQSIGDAKLEPISEIVFEENSIQITKNPKNINRKLNLSTIDKSKEVQINLPILPLKEILDPKNIQQVEITKKASISQDKNFFDIINTIPTINTAPEVKNTNPLTKIQNSIANIYCKTQNGNTISLVTGSAVIINSHGVALTNAHVAQYPLIEKYFKGNQGKTMDCYGRIGSPASGTYKIDVLYISPDWIRKNARNIIDPSFTETGQDDLAIIRLVASNNKPFTHTEISDQSPSANLKIYIASYPANEIREKGLNASLFGKYEESAVRQIDFYNQSKPLLETQPSSLGQSGSSGGGIFDTNGNLLGTIALVVQSSNVNTPYIRALTIGHINKTLASFGTSLDQYIKNNPDIIQSNFKKTATELEAILIQTLSSSQ